MQLPQYADSRSVAIDCLYCTCARRREGGEGGGISKFPGGFAKLFGLPLSMLNNSVAELEQM